MSSAVSRITAVHLWSSLASVSYSGQDLIYGLSIASRWLLPYHRNSSTAFWNSPSTTVIKSLKIVRSLSSHKSQRRPGLYPVVPALSVNDTSQDLVMPGDMDRRRVCLIHGRCLSLIRINLISSSLQSTLPISLLGPSTTNPESYMLRLEWME
jgi:hypothetical protein